MRLLSSAFIVFIFCLLPFNAIAQTDKIQQSITAIKRSFYSEDQDYLTDGKRVVWVKSYKRWMPSDWATVSKEAPDVVKFLKQAIAHHRPDVLEQLMPDYYRAHGGVAAFEADIQRRK